MQAGARPVTPLKPICTAENVGRRISTYWDGDGEWFTGQVRPHRHARAS